MRVAVLKRPGELEIPDRPEPEPGPQEVRIRATAIGVGGDDTQYDHGRSPASSSSHRSCSPTRAAG